MDKIDFDALVTTTTEKVKALLDQSAQDLGGYADWDGEHELDYSVRDYVAQLLVFVAGALDDEEMELAA